jgi:rhamnosyltransferase subunit B
MMRAKRILFGNEFGAGRGHHVLLQRISDEVQKSRPDMQSRFFLPPRTRSEAIAHNPDYVFPEELKSVENQGAALTRCLVHSLCRLWMKDDGILRERLAMWEREINTFKPDLVIADFAPSLSMAARGKVPCFVVGNGYTLPPPEVKMCLPRSQIEDPEDAKSEGQWLAELNLVLRQSGAQRLDFLPQVNFGDAYGVFTIPLFDIYWEDRQQDYLGVEHPGGSPLPSKANDGMALAYFSTENENATVIDGLIESQIPTLAYFGQLSSTLADRVKGTNIQLVEKPFHLARDLPGRALAIHAGSLGMSAAGVYAGIPQVGLYFHDEGLSNCRSFKISQIGEAAWSGKATPREIAQMMHKAKDSALMRNYATALSHRYASYRNESAAAKAATIAIAIMS